jgi:predicted enzyme involved in methoxymalonyl-ACP biosynthesis
MMNYLKSYAAARGLSRIVGRYLPTSHNSPCKMNLRENGFQEEGEVWIFPVTAGLEPDPQWLRVELPSDQIERNS